MGLLVAVAVIAVLMLETGTLWSTLLRREREAQLLAQGEEIRRAIGRYYEAGGLYPKSLDDLLLDRRQPTVRRYLRRAYQDPLQVGAEWGIIAGPGETVMGLYSQAPGQPLKQGNFRQGQESFSGQGSYQGWQFLYRPGQSNPPKGT
ncbi:type II secretion system protein [Pseudomonas vanderleydeniana]|uniref:Type II secretion system protein n=1 Tax=Pseudomonas vanderleydeniana TaxID=2745495 RepID=A0A9E6PRC4_9PSED|nr:type II secretion system protein [Pseudomonas vanderleydeniana]QXI31657.1 type II secretion system protein [Pseudomonas vanderleydeniana]